ncbi:MAG: hypothetical protein HY898_27580 [Deltaproteobacteria bacterium]|nr:hypothetical protein [Deltaproteobacteria bacterium]
MILRRKLALAVALAAMPIALASCESASDSSTSSSPAADTGAPDTGQAEDGATEAESDASQADGDLSDAGEVDGAKSDAPPADAGELSQADYPAAIASAICDNIGACCTAHGYLNNVQMCRDQIQGTYQDLMDAMANSAGVTYDAKAAADCVEQYKAYVLKCIPDPSDTDALNAVCNKVVVGTTQNGQACTHSFECAGSATGDSVCNDESDADGGSYRQCEQASGTLPHGSAGATCSESCRVMTGSHTTCDRVDDYVEAQATCWVEDGLRCDAATHTCVAVQAVGADCNTDTDCQASAYCATNVCAVLPTDNQPCDPDLPIQCTSNSHCDSTSTVCAPDKKAGDACSEPLECESWQCHAGTCQPEGLIATYFCIES